MEKLLKDPEVNTCAKGENILPVSNGVFDEAYLQGVNFGIDDFTQTINEICDAVHKALVGTGEINPDIKKQVLAEIAFDERPIGRKYTPEAIFEAVHKTIFQYEPYKSMAGL